MLLYFVVLIWAFLGVQGAEILHSLGASPPTPAGSFLNPLTFHRTSVYDATRLKAAVATNELYHLYLVQPDGSRLHTSIPAACLAVEVDHPPRLELLRDASSYSSITYIPSHSTCALGTVPSSHRGMLTDLPVETLSIPAGPVVLKPAAATMRAAATSDDLAEDLGQGRTRPPPEEKSFWQKNWMLIIPVGFLAVNMVMGG